MGSQRVRHIWATFTFTFKLSILLTLFWFLQVFHVLFLFQDWILGFHLYLVFLFPCCSVTKTCPSLCGPMDCIMSGSSVLSSLLQQHNLKTSILWLSTFFMIQLSCLYMTTGKTTALTMQTFVSKVTSLLYNILSRFVIAFLPRSKCLLISWLQSSSTVILESPQINFSLIPLFLLLWAMIEGGKVEAIKNVFTQILKDDAVKLLHSICQQIWKTQQ